MPSQNGRKFSECLPALAPSGLPSGLVNESSFGHPNTSKTSINQNKFCRGPSRLSGAGAPVLWREAEGTGLIQPWEDVASGGPFKGVPESLMSLSRWWNQEFTAVCAERTRDIGRTETKGNCTLVDTRKKCFTMRTVKPWKRVGYLPTQIFTEFVRICEGWVTSPDLIAVPALRRMTRPSCIALWFTWDGGESLPNSDLPKAVERSFLFLQIWVQGDRWYNPCWTFFCLFTFDIICRMMKEPQ